MSRWSKESLLSREAVGEKLEFVFFWNEGQTDPRCVLNQWYRNSFIHCREAYKTAEHAMMAAKADLFGDTQTFNEIMQAGTPYAAKALGRLVTPFDDDVWAKHRLEIVTDINIDKFIQDEEAAQYLLSTGDAILVEASPTDKIWGIGLDENDPNAKVVSNWRGINQLGEALMLVRDFLNHSSKV